MSEAEKLKEIVLEQLKLDEANFSREMSIDSLAIDSLELLELLVTIEEESDITLDDEQLNKTATMGEMFDYLLEKISDES